MLPRFADIRVAVSTDFDIGTGISFAFGYRVNYGVPRKLRAADSDGPRYERAFAEIARPMLVPDPTLESEGQILEEWLRHLVADLHRAHTEVAEGYRNTRRDEQDRVSIQFFLWDRLTFHHLCRVFGRHLSLLQAPAAAQEVDLNPMAWLFPADTLLEEADFVSRSSPVTVVSDAVNSLITAPIPTTTAS